MIPTPKLRVDGPPRSKSNPKPPFCYCSSPEESPRRSLPSLIYHAQSLGMTYTDDARVASLNITHHHRLLVWETSGGKLGTLASYRHTRAILPNFETLDPWVAGQWAACDIYCCSMLICHVQLNTLYSSHAQFVNMVNSDK